MSHNSLLLIPASNVASPIVTPVIPVEYPMVFQVETALPSSLYLSQTSSRMSLHGLSSYQSFPPPSSALSQPHPSSFLCSTHPHSISVPAVIDASPSSKTCIPVVPSWEVVPTYVVGYSNGFPSRLPLCSPNSSNNRAKVGFKSRLQRLLGLRG